jgi:Sec-independent protein secretion pathway component TatC
MYELTRWRLQFRGYVYIALALAAGIATPGTDAATMLMVWLLAIVIFEVGYFVYRRYG